jgi:Uncharacterized conserved protein (DUF2293)
MIDLAVVAHIRHAHTRYDEMLASGWERREARGTVTSSDRAVAHGTLTALNNECTKVNPVLIEEERVEEEGRSLNTCHNWQ